MEVQIFGTKKSPATRAALRFFAERRIRTHFVDLQQRAASPGELRRFIQKFGIEAVLDNESKRYAELGLRSASYGDERWLQLLADEPLLPLTAMNAVMSITGSGLLALALRHGLLSAEDVWVAAHVDEDHNIELWGEVEEITTRRRKRRAEFDSAVRLLEMLTR